MKYLNTTLTFLLMLIMCNFTHAQTCNVDAVINYTGNPGEIEIIDNSTTSSGAAATYSWVDFFEGTTWNYEGIVHLQPNSNTGTYQFTENGTYYYYINVQDSITNCYDSIGGSITINNIPVNCDANFTYIDTIDNEIAFSPDSYDTNLEYHWDFGDGNYSNNPYPFHNYANPGTYTACLTVWDNAGSSNCADTVCQTIEVDSIECNISADYTYTQLGNGVYEFEVINISNNTIYDWSIDSENYTGPNVTHTFSSNGQFYATVIATDTTNPTCLDTANYIINVTDVDTCNFNASFTYMDTINNQTAFSPDSYDNNLNYHWDFGDGLSSNASHPFHNYTNPGTYTVCLTVWDSSGNSNCADTVCQTITINNTTNCDASFSYYSDTINNNQISFYPNNYDANLGYSWDFGDGNFSSDPYPYHTYSAPGTYTACLTVWDNSGNYNCADTVCQTITINNTTNCDASFSYYSDTTNNNTTYFYPNNYDANLGYSWDFGDGNFSSNPYPYHTYNAPGTYTACLTVWDNSGNYNCADTVCQTIIVTNDSINCNADFYLFQDSLNSNVYYIWNLSSGNNLSYSWDFGDGAVSSQQYPTHTYTSQGIFNICLTITDNNGNCTDQYCQTIEVLNKATGTTINVVPFGQTADLEEENIITDVKLFPNPTSNSINISLRGNIGNDYNYQIVDVMGNQIELGRLKSNQNVASKEINVEQLQQGVYFVQIIESSNKEKVKTLKFIKK